ncbi:MAG: SDR family NAD(P)-dependent oxidoreductase, partial [Actinophytocola sp.]|uniref:SDR family NAD(P)-dependent oxidoreductase n=1 Tax=Actinophytocola sp. TaxID=1872138 RepID=UPI003C726142
VLPWLVSGASTAGLRGQARRLAPALSGGHPDLDLARSLATTRTPLDHRAVVLAADRAQAMTGLAALAAGEESGAVVTGTVSGGGVAFLFTGQGAQRAGMGAGLRRDFPVFAGVFDDLLARLGGVPLDDADALDQTRNAQAGLFALEVALFRLLESWGVTPDFLLGHSIGEVAAAHVAGVLSIEDACSLVAARGRLMQGLPSGGAMLAAEVSEVDVPAGVDVAAVNGPGSVVVSGAEEEIAALESRWRGAGRRVKRLAVSHAFHSRLMEPMLAEFADVARSLTYHAPRIPVIPAADGDDVTDPGYWVRQIRGTVRFADGVRLLRERHVTTFAEIGPDAVLATHLDSAVPLLRAGRDETASALRALSELHVSGVDVDWTAVFDHWGGGEVDLPTYAFQRIRHWPARATPPAADWHYRTRWTPVTTTEAQLAGTWWIVEPPGADDMAAACADAVTRHGGTAVRITGLDGLADRTGRPDGVLSLLALDDRPHPGHPLLTRGLADSLAVLRTVSAPLWVATADTPGDPTAMAVAALGRVAALEHPDRWGGVVALHGIPDPAALAAVLAGDEDQVAIRPEGTVARRLVRADGTGQGGDWRPHGTVLVTGGTGALGRHTARWLARHGADHVLLVSRAGDEAPGAADLVAELNALGAKATVAACDVADADALRALLAAVPAEHPLTAVVHAAGIGDLTPLAGTGADRLATVLAAKADGARNLDALCG